MPSVFWKEARSSAAEPCGELEPNECWLRIFNVTSRSSLSVFRAHFYFCAFHGTVRITECQRLFPHLVEWHAQDEKMASANCCLAFSSLVSHNPFCSFEAALCF